METIFHDDKTITYWSVKNQCWRKRVSSLCQDDIDSMPYSERVKVLEHLKIEDA